MLTKLGMASEQVDVIFKSLDKNGNGFVSPAEFLDWVFDPIKDLKPEPGCHRDLQPCQPPKPKVNSTPKACSRN